MELELVQALCNPHYLSCQSVWSRKSIHSLFLTYADLAYQGILEDEAFAKYLSYLRCSHPVRCSYMGQMLMNRLQTGLGLNMPASYIMPTQLRCSSCSKAQRFVPASRTKVWQLKSPVVFCNIGPLGETFHLPQRPHSLTPMAILHPSRLLYTIQLLKPETPTF